MRSARREEGYLLVETLVALALLALAAAGLNAVVSSAANRALAVETERAALAELRERLHLGESGSGAVALAPGVRGRWTVTVSEIDRGAIAGTPVVWERVEARIDWPGARGREVSRMIMRPQQ